MGRWIENEPRKQKIFFALAVAIVVVLAIDGAIHIAKFTGYATIETEAGTISELEIIYKPPTTLWAGVYGIALRIPGFPLNQTQVFEGGDMLEKNLLFDCIPTTGNHEIYVTMEDPININWDSLTPATLDDIDSYMAVDPTDFQSATRTYLSTISILLGTRNISNIPATYTYIYDRVRSSTFFDVGVLKDASSRLVFTAHIRSNFTYSFNNRLYNYQMILPIRNGTSQEYYFTADPNNVCPQGFGETPPVGFVTGFVTDEEGNPIEGAIIEVAGTVTLSNMIGNYSMEPPEGEHNIWAVKTGYQVYNSNITVIANTTTIYNIVMSKINTETKTKLYDQQQTATTNNPPPNPLLTGRYTQKPVIEQPKRIEGTDYLISVGNIRRKIRQDNFLQEQIFFISYKKIPAVGNFKVTGDVAQFFSLDKDHIVVNPNSKEYVTFTIFGKGSPAVYNGTLEITGDLNATVPIEIEILSKDKLPVEALLLDIDVSKKSVKPGETFKFDTHLRNLLTDEAFPVELFYTIQTPDGNETIWSYHTNIFLTTAVTIRKEVRLPGTIRSGDYILAVTANYLDLSSGTSTLFFVTTPFWKILLFGKIPIWWVFIFAGLVAGGFVAYILIKRNIESKKKFHLKVDYNELPKLGPRSIFVGKIAETTNRTYMNMENFKTHTIVAGSTGGGKSFSAQGIIEEMLIKNVAIIAFDPTAQWTGMLRKQNSKFILDLYAQFGMKKEEARAFNGNIKEVRDKRELIDIKKYMRPGEIQVFACHKLEPKDMDMFVANVIRQVFRSNFDESANLRLMLVFDEVHRLLPKFGGSGDGFLQIERGCREFRKWGIGILLISQVLADFVGQIKANINTEIQMRTRDEGDLERIRVKYGEEVLRSLVKATVGAGMVENPAYNRGQPYFIAFRPLLHSVERLSDEEIEKYTKYNFEADNLIYSLEQLEKEGIDVFDLKLELKLAQDKIKTGNFNMVEIYLEGVRPRIDAHWQKLGKAPKKYEIPMVSESDMAEALVQAKKSRDEYLKAQGGSAAAAGGAAPEKPKDLVALFKMDVGPEKIFNLSNGMIVTNANNLIDELSAMKKDDFEKMVNYDVNKVADWVRDAVGDADLAAHLEPILDKKHMIEILEIRKKGEKLPPVEKKPPKPMDPAAAGAPGAAPNAPGTPAQGAAPAGAATPGGAAATSPPGTAPNTAVPPGTAPATAGRPVRGQVAPEKAFKLKDGKAIASIDDLVATIKVIPDEQLKDYVNETKNEFYSWIKDVVQDAGLAEKVREAHTKNELLEALA